jgi:hypothetical protein
MMRANRIAESAKAISPRNCSDSSNAKRRRFSYKVAYRQISKRSREPRKIGIRSQLFGQLKKAVFGR